MKNDETKKIEKIMLPTFVKLFNYLNIEIKKEPYVPIYRETGELLAYTVKYHKLMDSFEKYENENHMNIDLHKCIYQIDNEEEKDLYEEDKDIKIILIDECLFVFKFNLLMMCLVRYDFEKKEYNFFLTEALICKIEENDKIVISTKKEQKKMSYTEKPLLYRKKDLSSNMLLGGVLGGVTGAYIAKNKVEEHNKFVDDYYKNFDRKTITVDYTEKTKTLKMYFGDNEKYTKELLYDYNDLKNLKKIFDTAKDSSNIEKGNNLINEFQSYFKEFKRKYNSICEEEKSILNNINELEEQKKKISIFNFKEKKELKEKIEKLIIHKDEISNTKKVQEEILELYNSI